MLVLSCARGVLAALCVSALSALAGAQAQVVQSWNFESGTTENWQFSGGPLPLLWHLAAAGECGAPMASFSLAYNRGVGLCNYNVGFVAHNAIARSPNFVLTGLRPYKISLDYVRNVAGGGETSTVKFVNAEPSRAIFDLRARF